MIDQPLPPANDHIDEQIAVRFRLAGESPLMLDLQIELARLRRRQHEPDGPPGALPAPRLHAPATGRC